MGLSRKDFRKIFCLMEWNAQETHKLFDKRGNTASIKKMMGDGGGLLDSQNFTGKKKSSKTTQLQICFYLKKKFRRMTLRVEYWAQRLEPRTIVDYSQTLKHYVICPAEFWNVLRWLTSSFSFFHFILFWVGMSITVVNVKNHCTLEAGNIGAQMERNLAPYRS